MSNWGSGLDCWLKNNFIFLHLPVDITYNIGIIRIKETAQNKEPKVKRIIDSIESKQDAINFINNHDVWNCSKLSEEERKAYWVDLVDGFYSDKEIEENSFYWSDFQVNAYQNAVQESGMSESQFVAALLKLAEKD